MRDAVIIELFSKKTYVWHKSFKALFHVNAATFNLFLLVKYGKMYSLEQYNYLINQKWNNLDCVMFIVEWMFFPSIFNPSLHNIQKWSDTL